MIHRYAQFWFLEKGLGIVFHQILCMIFQEKCFMLQSINWPNFVFWYSLPLDILGNMCIAIVYFPGCGIINFEIHHIFLIKPFLYMTKKWRLKFKYLENKSSFKVKWKVYFIIFKELSVPKNCLRPESAPLKKDVFVQVL